MNIEETIHIPGWGIECIVCGKDVTGGRGFAHVRHNDEMIALCGPICLEMFEHNPKYYIFRRDAVELVHRKEDLSLN
jgi:ribosomal protein L24E